VSKTKPPRVQAPRTRPRNAPRKRAAPAAPPSRKRLYLAAGAVAAAAAAILIAISVAGGSGDGQAEAKPVTGGAETAALLRGIPQRGTTLGSPDAPVKLVEYADLQCVYCAAWARDVFPTLVRDYVRPGKVQLELRGMTFVGPDSDTALRTALAASQQNRLWHLVELVFLNQGAENSGWVSDSLLRGALAQIPGVDADKVLAARDSAAVTALVERSARQAQAAGINSTPSFLLGRTGGPLERLEVAALDAPSFTAPIETLLGG
jgi:protein-disulfide isomerase